MAFQLVSEPWILCETVSNERVEVGLRDLFSRAHQLSEVVDASPLVTAALYRMLLAILHRVFGPPSLGAWKALYERTSFDLEPLDHYFDTWASRFDLLDPERPFMQVRGLRELGYRTDPIDRLIFERSNYGAAVDVFQHRPATTGVESVSFGEAARLVLALHAFAPGGLVKKVGEPGSATAAPLNRGAVVLVRGSTLFETLLLNLIIYPPAQDLRVTVQVGRDIPSWEQPPLARPVGEKEPKRRAYGWIDWLTWQSRRVELVLTDDAQRVAGIVYCVGHGLDDDATLDPMLAFRKDEKRGFLPIEFSEDRAVFRDFPAVVRAVGADDAGLIPCAMAQLARSELRSLVPATRRLQVELFGMRGDQAAIKLTRHERMVVPVSLLGDPMKGEVLANGTHLAEETGRAVVYAVRDAVRAALAPGGRDPDKEEVRRLASALGAERQYWARLSEAYETFVDRLANENQTALATFTEDLRTAALEEVARATLALGASSRSFKGCAIAERNLRIQLATILAPQGESS